MSQLSSRLWTRDQVAQRILVGDTIVIYNSLVLRITSNWLASHPGGALAILHFVGRDATGEIDAYHNEETLKRVKGFVVGRVEVDEKEGWEPLVPPVAQGWVRRNDQWHNEATAVRVEEDPEVTADPAPVRSEILLVARNDMPTTGPSLASLTPPSPSLSLAQQNQHAVAYRQLHERVTAAGHYKTRYLAGYGPEVVRYTLAAAVSYFAYQKGWFLLSAVFLGLLWHQLSFFVHDLGHMGVTHNWAIDRLVAILLADCIGGLSIGWWVDVSALCYGRISRS